MNAEYQKWADGEYPYDFAECSVCLSGHGFGACAHKDHEPLRKAAQKAELVKLIGKLRKMTYSPGIRNIRETFVKLRKRYARFWKKAV